MDRRKWSPSRQAAETNFSELSLCILCLKDKYFCFLICKMELIQNRDKRRRYDTQVLRDKMLKLTPRESLAL